MIEMPDFQQPWDYENAFYLTCDETRMSKVLAHYELFKLALSVPGAIVECGVFKGVSLARWAIMRQIFSSAFSKKIVAFDSFGRFPDTEFERTGKVSIVVPNPAAVSVSAAGIATLGSRSARRCHGM